MDALTATLAPLFQVAIVAAFILLGMVAVVRAPRSGVAGRWAAAAFGVLAVVLSVVWVPQWLDTDLPAGVADIAIVLLLSFPYLLLRFTATFRSLPRALEVAAAAAAVVAVLVTVVPGADAGPLGRIWALVYWTGVSSVSVVRLWRAGQGQPGVARRRLRLMAAGAAVLAVALIASVQLGDAPAAELLTDAFVLASALTFGLGFAPPRPLRLAWRRDEDERVQAAVPKLLRADTAEDVARHLLPPTMAIIGASGAALVAPDGRVAASHGQAPQVGERVSDTGASEEGPSREAVPLGEGHGQLMVWTSPYTPFFGREERALIQSMSAVAGLALERCALLADERGQRAELEQARQQAEQARTEAEQAHAEADAANRAKSEFLSRMSHELRTPLNAVLGFGQLLEIATLAEEDQEAVRHILKAGRHLLALIDDVLDLTRIEAGMLSVSLEPVHVGDLVRDSIALVQPLAVARAIAVTTDAEECDDFVRTDRQRCRQVLLNLLSNAVKYNHDGGAVEVNCWRPGDETLRIAVRDTGPGIEPARRDRLFQPFERLGAEESTVQGTGLGLALTRQLVERLGGTIGLDTVPGSGSTFWVDLPLTSPSARPMDMEPRPGVAEASGEHQILLVEDNLDNLELVQAFLRRRPGISVLPAMQGTLALELAFQHRPDLIVLDLHLPDLSGRDVLARLRGDPRTRDIPVVVASADATPGRIRQLRDEGVFDYVTKPLDLGRFLQVVDAALSRRADPG